MRGGGEGKIPVYFFGSTSNALEAAKAALLAENPDLIVAGLEAPPFGFDPTWSDAARYGEKIAASGARLCFVCLGAPKQELFADRLHGLYPGVGFLCVGAALDFIARTQSRAPAALRRVGLEWAWRLAADPRRLAWRYAQCAILLARLTIEEAFKAASPSREKQS